MQKKKLLWLSLCIFTSSCTTVEIPNVTGCSVAGILSAGMDCSESVSGKQYPLDFDATMRFLEGDGEGHGAAVCMSPADLTRLKIAIEHLCLKTKCTPEQVEATREMAESISRLL